MPLDTKFKVNREQETSGFSYFTLALLHFNNMHVLAQKKKKKKKALQVQTIQVMINSKMKLMQLKTLTKYWIELFLD